MGIKSKEEEAAEKIEQAEAENVKQSSGFTQEQLTQAVEKALSDYKREQAEAALKSQQKAELKKSKEEGNFQEAIDKLESEKAGLEQRLSELQEKETTLAAYTELVDSILAERTKDLPSAVKVLVDSMPPIDRIKWLNEHSQDIQSLAAPTDIPETKNGGTIEKKTTSTTTDDAVARREHKRATRASF